MLLSREEGGVHRQGGGFVFDPNPGRVSLIMLPKEYSIGNEMLLRFEKSSALPSLIIAPIKDFHAAVMRNSEDLIRVLDKALRENLNYYFLYDDDKSPYFHEIDAMWLDKFVQLQPKADN